MLNDIESNAKTCKTDYEQTQIWKFQGYVHYSLEDFNGAIRAYKQVDQRCWYPARISTGYALYTGPALHS